MADGFDSIGRGASNGAMEGTATVTRVILFADIAGSTRLYETLGDAAAKARVTRLQRLIASLAEPAGGRVQEIVGDEVMLTFDAAADGARCALEIQRRVSALPAEQEVPQAVRIGLHLGPVIAEGERLFGDTVNVAARVTAVARGGQIMLSQAVLEALPPELTALARPFDLAPLKGKRDPLPVHELTWQSQDLTRLSGGAPAPATAALRLCHGERECTLAPEGGEFVLGRAGDADLVVAWPSVSRHHAVLAYQRGRFVLSDTSSNGTHLVLQTGEVVFLRRESLPLWGEGRLCLGGPPEEAEAAVVSYRCL